MEKNKSESERNVENEKDEDLKWTDEETSQYQLFGFQKNETRGIIDGAVSVSLAEANETRNDFQVPSHVMKDAIGNSLKKILSAFENKLLKAFNGIKNPLTQ